MSTTSLGRHYVTPRTPDEDAQALRALRRHALEQHGTAVLVLAAIDCDWLRRAAENEAKRQAGVR